MVQILFPNSRRSRGIAFDTATFASDPTTGLVASPGGMTLVVGGNSVAQVSNSTIQCSSISVTGNYILDYSTGKPLVSNVSITDDAWETIQSSFLTANSTDSYFVVSGSNFKPGSLVQVNDLNSISTSFLSTHQLGVRAPSLPSGTYFVQVIGSDGRTSGKTRTIRYN